MCERHTTKVYLNKEQAQRDGTKVKIREMKALRLFQPLSVVCRFPRHRKDRKRRPELTGYPEVKQVSSTCSSSEPNAHRFFNEFFYTEYNYIIL